MRLFFALKPPEHIHNDLIQHLAHLKHANTKGNIHWAKSSNLHITLQFLGNVPSEQIEMMNELGRKISPKIMPFYLQLHETAFFPTVKKAKVIIQKITAPPPLEKLVKLLRDGMHECGLEYDERTFKPHLTLGRIRNNVPTHRIKLVPAKPYVFLVDHFDLYQSELTELGRSYQLIERFRLSAQMEYDYYAHQAGIGIIGRGITLEYAFIAAAQALFAIMTNLEQVQILHATNIEFAESDPELALITWLNKLIEQAAIHHVVFCEFKLIRQNDVWVGIALGEPWREGLARGTDVKGATLTELYVKQNKELCEVRCIIDV